MATLSSWNGRSLLGGTITAYFSFSGLEIAKSTVIYTVHIIYIFCTKQRGRFRFPFDNIYNVAGNIYKIACWFQPRKLGGLDSYIFYYEVKME